MSGIPQRRPFISSSQHSLITLFPILLLFFLTSAPNLVCGQNAPKPEWSASVFLGLTKDADFHPIGVLSMSLDHFYVEGRYNYEDFQTGSVFLGWYFDIGSEKVNLELTPILGGVFGNSNGLAPGLELNFGLGRLNLYSESEYFIDLQADDDYLYTWSELTFRIWSWLQPGYVAQKTKVFDTGAFLENGIMINSEAGNFTFSLYGFNPFSDENRYFQMGISVDF